jgi:hypothetical protein
MDQPDDFPEPRLPASHPPLGWLAATALLALPAVALIVLRLLAGA